MFIKNSRFHYRQKIKPVGDLLNTINYNTYLQDANAIIKLHTKGAIRDIRVFLVDVIAPIY